MTLIYHVLDYFSRFLNMLPLSALKPMSDVLAFLVFSVVRLRRELILKNLTIAFGDRWSSEERKKLATVSYSHFILTCLEFLRERNGRLGDNVSIDGLAMIQDVLAQGQGAYILCTHMSSWEAMGAAFCKQIGPSHVIVKKVGSPGVDRFVAEQRRKNGFSAMERRKKGDVVQGIRRALKAGEVVGFVMDQSRPGEPEIPLFQVPAKTNTSFAAIWRKLPAPILPAYIVRQAPGVYNVKILPPLKMIKTDDDKADIMRHSQDFNHVVEHIIRQCPEQYFWMHDRWKKGELHGK